MHRSKNRVSNDVARHYAPPSPSADPWKKYVRERSSLDSSRKNQDSESSQAWLFAVVVGFGFMMIACVFFAAFVVQYAVHVR